jgi:hypothetical protein
MANDVNRSFGSFRAFAAIRSSPVAMAGGSSLCIEGRILPWYGAHVSHEQIQLPLAASPCSRLSRPQSTISQSDFRQVIGSFSPYRLVRPYKLGLNLAALPCSHETLRLHASGTNPGSTPGHSPWRILEFGLPRWRIGSATSITIDFGAILSFTCVPAYNLPVYAS